MSKLHCLKLAQIKGRYSLSLNEWLLTNAIHHRAEKEKPAQKNVTAIKWEGKKKKPFLHFDCEFRVFLAENNAAFLSLYELLHGVMRRNGYRIKIAR